MYNVSFLSSGQMLDDNGLGLGDFAASLIEEPVVGTAVPDIVEAGIEVTEDRAQVTVKGPKRSSKAARSTAPASATTGRKF